MSSIIKVIIAIVIVCTGVNYMGSGESPADISGDDYTVTDEVKYDDLADEVDYSENDYEEPAPEKIFEPSDLVGKWVNNTDSTYPDVLEISKSGDTYYYEYYGYAPGDASGIGYGVQSTKWEYCDSTVLMNPYSGNFECNNSSLTDTYEKFIYINENTIMTDDDGEYFHRDNDFEYVNPYADNDDNGYGSTDSNDEEDLNAEAWDVIYSIENLLKLSYFTEDEMMEALEVEDEDTNFYSVNYDMAFDKSGTLNFGLDYGEVSYIGWYHDYSEFDENAVEDSQELYDLIIDMLEEVYEVTGGYENYVDEDHSAYICEYDGKEINVERTVDFGIPQIYFRVCE